MDGGSKKEKPFTQDERSEPHPSYVFSTAGIRRAFSITYRDYRELLVSCPGLLFCIRVVLASIFLFR